jgi:hypothetical protein
MTVSLTSSVTYPIPSKETQVSFSATAGNYVKLYCTAAPLGSGFRDKIDKLEAGTTERAFAFAGDSSDIWRWTPDAGGVYTFLAEEITKGASAHGGGYLGDPDGYESETILGTTTGLTVTVGTLLTASIGAGADTATLKFYVFDYYIRATTLATHGVITPSLDDPTTSKARMAADSDDVKAALAELADKTVNAVLSLPAVWIDDLIVQYEAHRVSQTFHTNADADNAISADYRLPTSCPAGAAKALNELRLKLTRHMLNDDAGSGIGTGNYHVVSGNQRADLVNGIITGPASEQDALSLCLALADTWRAYEAHRVHVNYHIGGGDTTNDAYALPQLLALYEEFISQLQVTSPAVPAGESAGVAYAINSGGFKAS